MSEPLGQGSSGANCTTVKHQQFFTFVGHYSLWVNHPGTFVMMTGN